MSFKKVLFASVSVLTVLLLRPYIISNINDTIILSQVKAKIVKLSKDQKEIVSKAGRTSSMSSELFTSRKEKRLDLFSNMERRVTIEEDIFFGLNKYFSRDGFTLNFPVNRSLHLATSLSPLNLERGTKLRLKHRNGLTIFNNEVTLGFTGDYGLRFGLTRYF